MENVSTQHLAVAACRFFVVAIGMVITTSVSQAQSESDTKSGAYHAGIKQQQVQGDAASIRAALAELREQMRELMPDEVGSVDRAIAQLQELSDGEMQNAILSLQGASTSEDASDQFQQIAEALAVQGTVEIRLKRLSVDLKARETIAALDLDLESLIRSQVAILLEIARLGRIQQFPGELRDQHLRRYQVANDEQVGVTADLHLLTRKLDHLLEDVDAESPISKAMEVATAGQLTQSADEAMRLIESGPFNQALEAQTEVVRTLVRVRQAISAGSTPLDRLQQFASRLEATVADQKEVMDAVMLIGERQDLARNYKQMQSNLAAEVVAVRFELEPLNALATNQLVTAEGFIDRALANYIRMWEEHMDARVNTREAHQSIVLAHQSLQQQMATIEANTPKTPDQLADALRELHRGVEEIARFQAEVARNPQTPPERQEAAQNRVNQLQQLSLPVSPEASELLAQAANQMAMPDTEAQNEAAESLADAAEELADQIADLAALEETQEQLEEAAELADQAIDQLENGETAAATNALTAAQAAAEAAQAAAGEAAPEAADALEQAAENLAQASMAAAQTQAETAQTATQAAAAALAEAQSQLAQALEQTPGMTAMMGVGTEISEDPQGEGTNPQSQGNAGTGPSGDDLVGVGDTGARVEVLRGLSDSERDAVTQLQNEAPPPQFAPAVQQYYQNLADGVEF